MKNNTRSIRVFLTVLITVLVLLLTIGGQFLFAYRNHLKSTDRKLYAHMATVNAQLSMMESRVKSQEDQCEQFDLFCLDFAARILPQDSAPSQSDIDELNNAMEEGYAFSYFDADGSAVLLPEGVLYSSFTPEEKQTLFSPNGGELKAEHGSHFISRPHSGGYLMLTAPTAGTDYSLKDELADIGDETILVLSADGTPLEDKCAARGDFTEETLRAFAANADESKLRVDTKLGVVYKAAQVDNDIVIVAAIRLKAFILDTLQSISVVVILFSIVAFVLLFYALSLSKRREKENKPVLYIRLFRKLKLDRSLVSHVSALLVFAMLLTAVMTVYVDVLYFMSAFNIAAVEDEEDTRSLLKVYRSISDQQDMEAAAQSKNMAGLLCLSLEKTPDSQAKYKLQEIRENYSSILEIDFYDRNGTLVASDTGYTGYKLVLEEGKPETECMRLLSGDSDVISIDVPDSTYRYIGVRRKDGKGIVRIKIDDSDRMWNYLNVNEFLTGALSFFGEGNKYYCFKSDDAEDSDFLPGEVIVADADRYTEVSVPKSMLLNGTYSFATLDNTLQYTHVKEHSTSYVVRGKPFMPYLLNDVLVGLLITLAGQLLLWLGLIFTAAPFRANAENAPGAERENIFMIAMDRDKHLSVHFSRAVKWLINVLILAVILLLIVDYIVQQDYSLVVFLLGKNWVRGLNIFSITDVLALLVLEQLISNALTKTILLVANNMNAKGRTIGRMLASMTRFLLMLAFIVYSLVLFGVNITTLLAGAGIVGAALSFCAQSTVTDILSGLFIIFEGHIRVGDWIEVDGKMGEIYEIGIRTSVLAKDNAFFVINNGKMSDLKKLSPSRSGPNIQVSIGYGENIDHVIDLIESNRELYRKEIPQMTAGPYVAGVTDLGDSGVSIRMYAKSSTDTTGAVENSMRRVTKKLFDMNGIEIPWPQIVVHNSEPVLHENKQA